MDGTNKLGKPLSKEIQPCGATNASSQKPIDNKINGINIRKLHPLDNI
jgi:hypothetical protein